MVAARQGNVKRKNIGNGANNQNAAANRQGNRKFKAGPSGGVGGSMNNKPQRMNMRAGIGAMFNPSQMMDNPGYMDFNEPPARIPNQKQFKNNANQIGNSNSNNKSNRNRRMNNNNNNNGNNNQQRNQGNVGNGGGRWGGPQRGGNGGGGPFPLNNGNNMRMPPMHGGGGGPPFRGGPHPSRMHPMGPMPPMGGMRPPMMPPMPPPHIADMRFGPRPLMMPPMGRNMQPMGGGGGPMRRPFTGRMGPPPLGGGGGGNAMMGRGMNRASGGGGGPGPLRRNGKMPGGPIGKAGANVAQRRPVANQKNLKNRRKTGPQKPGTGKKSNQPVNKYDLDKPWVTNEIKEACKAKVDLENQLKGKKNDEIFAQFKVQRDKFVDLYDVAKAEYQAKNAEQGKEKKESDKSPKVVEQNKTTATNAKPNTAAS